MKSTQDIVIKINEIASLLGQDVLSIEIFTNKSFMITKYTEGEQKVIFDSDTSLTPIDINDFGYMESKDIINQITMQEDKEIIEETKLITVKFQGVEL